MKIALFTIFLMALLCASTCKKESYDCVCTASNGTNNGYAVQNQYYGDIPTSSANAQCSSWINVQQANLSAAGGTASVNCNVISN